MMVFWAKTQQGQQNNWDERKRERSTTQRGGRITLAAERRVQSWSQQPQLGQEAKTLPGRGANRLLAPSQAAGMEEEALHNSHPLARGPSQRYASQGFLQESGCLVRLFVCTSRSVTKVGSFVTSIGSKEMLSCAPSAHQRQSLQGSLLRTEMDLVSVQLNIDVSKVLRLAIGKRWPVCSQSETARWSGGKGEGPCLLSRKENAPPALPFGKVPSVAL